jgi:catechol 2,3-dioxygenase-like lactoylglutathione lyase family enzyme
MVESAVPILPSRDLDETLEFYARLGFELQGAPIEKYRYLIIGRGSIELHFGMRRMSIPSLQTPPATSGSMTPTLFTASGRKPVSNPTPLAVVD